MNSFMKIAVDEARTGIMAGDGGPFGCVIVKDGSVIGRGHNQVIKKKDPTSHGEIMAIKNACKAIDSFDLSGCELYTTGEPCPMCMGAILWANISKVYYGCSIEDTQKIGFRDKAFYGIVNINAGNILSQIDRDECLELYYEYEKISDKTEY